MEGRELMEFNKFEVQSFVEDLRRNFRNQKHKIANKTNQNWGLKRKDFLWASEASSETMSFYKVLLHFKSNFC